MKKVIFYVVMFVIAYYVVNISYNEITGNYRKADQVKDAIWNIVPKSNEDNRKVQAWLHAKNIIAENMLLSPASAKYPEYSEKYIKSINSNKYLIKSYVESKNALNVWIKNNFEIEITLNSDGTSTGRVINIGK